MSRYVKYTSIDTQGVNVRSSYITGAVDPELKGMRASFDFPRATWIQLRKRLLTDPKARFIVPAFCKANGLTRNNFNAAWNSVFPNPEDQISALHARRKMNNKAGIR